MIVFTDCRNWSAWSGVVKSREEHIAKVMSVCCFTVVLEGFSIRRLIRGDSIIRGMVGYPVKVFFSKDAYSESLIKYCPIIQNACLCFYG